MTLVSSLLIGSIAFISSLATFPQQSSADDFYDRPLEIRRVDLKPDPLNPRAKREVACFTYPDFTIKQVDLGEVGAGRLSIIPAASGKAASCRQAKERNEYVIPAKVWSGYFAGVKSDYVFFKAADGINGGLGFMVFRVSDRKKLFEDVAQKGIQTIVSKDKTLKLQYQRVFSSRCSVITGGSTCENSIAKETGVAVESLASCTDGYQTAKEEMARMRCENQQPDDNTCFERELRRINAQKWDDAPTVITYEIEVALSGASPVIIPLSDALICRPSD